MSDQRWGHAAILSDGKLNHNNTSNKKARPKKSTQNANIHQVKKCQGVPGTTERLAIDGESLS